MYGILCVNAVRHRDVSVLRYIVACNINMSYPKMNDIWWRDNAKYFNGELHLEQEMMLRILDRPPGIQLNPYKRAAEIKERYKDNRDWYNTEIGRIAIFVELIKFLMWGKREHGEFQINAERIQPPLNSDGFDGSIYRGEYGVLIFNMQGIPYAFQPSATGCGGISYGIVVDLETKTLTYTQKYNTLDLFTHVYSLGTLERVYEDKPVRKAITLDDIYSVVVATATGEGGV